MNEDVLRCRIRELERQAAIKDAYAYELAKERDVALTQLSDAVEALARCNKDKDA
jgi:hypothetical protein